MSKHEVFEPSMQIQMNVSAIAVTNHIGIVHTCDTSTCNREHPSEELRHSMFTPHRYVDVLAVVKTGCLNVCVVKRLVVHCTPSGHWQTRSLRPSRGLNLMQEVKQFPPEFLSNIHDQLLLDSHLNYRTDKTQKHQHYRIRYKSLAPLVEIMLDPRIFRF